MALRSPSGRPGSGSLHTFWRWIYPDNVSNAAAILIAAIAALLGLFDLLDTKKLLSLTLSILALIAYSLIRDRVSRDGLNKSINSLIVSSTPAERFFSKQTSELAILQAAHQSAYLLQESGALVSERFQDELVRILHERGELKFIVCLPSGRAASTLAYRNENLDDPASILGRIEAFHSQLKSIKRSTGPAFRNVQVRYTPYDVGYTLSLANATSPASNRIGLIRFAGFRVPYRDKLDFIFDSKHSISVVNQYQREFDELFFSSTRLVLLTAEPRVGKTTMFEALLELCRERQDVYFVLSRRIQSQDNENAFSARSSVDNNEVVFAEKDQSSSYPQNDIRQYTVYPEKWDKYACEISDAIEQKKLIFIDEVGEMQLKNEKFCNIIKAIIANPEISMFATMATDEHRHPLLKELREHHRATVYQLVDVNKEILQRTLIAELKGALRLQEYMSTNG